MNNHKLYIQKSGSWSIVDLGDDKPAMNYQVNNIAELKDRQCDYSQALKLPLSKNNCILFDIPESMDVVSNIQYIKIPCRLYSNESLLAGPGSFLVIDKVNEFIEVAILSGNVDFFSIIDRPMSELDLGSYILGSKSIYDNYSNSNYCVASATFLKGGLSEIITDSSFAYPFVFLKNAITELVNQNGYTYETNLTDEQWNKKAISLCSLTSSDDSFTMFNSSAASLNNLGVNDYRVWLGTMSADLVDNGNGCLTTTDYDIGSKYKSQINGTLRINLEAHAKRMYVHTDYGDQNHLIVTIKNLTTDTVYCTQNEYMPVDKTPVSIAINQTLNVSYNDIIDIQISILPTNGIHLAYYSFNISELKCDEVTPNSKLHLSNNIGFDNQLDFFKNFVQLFGLTVDVNNETKVIRAYTMQKLYDNKSIAVDWSNKLHDVRTNDIYNTISGYAQNNFIRFVDNDSDNVKESGSFQVNNEKLDVWKDLFSMKFEAGKDNSNNNVIMANIPLVDKKLNIDTGTVNYSFSGGKPHIVEIIEIYLPHQPMCYVATHVKAQSFIDTFYPGLISMLTSAKYAEVEFWLTDKDIEEFNQEIPIYIQKYGHYFYVNKIVNYRSTVLTKCQIIKL